MVQRERNSPVGTSFRWELKGWSNRRVDSNQTIDSTIQVDSTTWFDRPSRLIRLPVFESTNILVGSSSRIDSTQIWLDQHLCQVESFWCFDDELPLVMPVEWFTLVVSAECYKLVELETLFESDIDSTIKIDSNLREESISPNWLDFAESTRLKGLIRLISRSSRVN